MINSSILPDVEANNVSITATSEDGIIQLVIPKISDDDRYSVQYAGTASLQGTAYALLFPISWFNLYTCSLCY